MDIREFALRKGLKDINEKIERQEDRFGLMIDADREFMRGTQWTPEQRATLEERNNGS